MDEQGFLPISLIAGFHRVQALTTNLNLILEVIIHIQNSLYFQLCCEPKTALKGLPLIIIKQQYKGTKQMYKVKLEDAKDLLKVVTQMILSIHWSKYFRE